MARFTRFLFWFILFLLLVNVFSAPVDDRSGDDVVVSTLEELVIGKEVIASVRNQMDAPLTVNANCPGSPLNVEFYSNGKWEEKTAESDKCVDEAVDILPGETATFSFSNWNQDIFGELGLYRVSLTTDASGEEKVFMNEITIRKPGLWTRFWQGFFYKPIYNTLIYFIKVVPHKDLGWAIILLTFIIKLILLIPNQKALKAQKRMQQVQPQLEALKKKYAHDQQMLAQETMKIWKKYKVNPMDSCLPILVQFPILIALFYVVRDVNVVNPTLLYPPFADFDVTSIQTNFMGVMELKEKSLLILPIIIGLLQFGQMKLSFAKLKNAQTNQLPMMNSVMLYGLPLMIAVFTASLPAAVGFYWGTSTLFGIGQQAVVNRSKD